MIRNNHPKEKHHHPNLMDTKGFNKRCRSKALMDQIGVQLSARYRTPKNRLQTSFLRSAFEDRQCRDITMNVRYEKITAHRLVLSSRSPVFEAMFRYDFTECVTGQIDLTESFSSAEQLEQFVRFLYGKSPELDWNNVPEFLDISCRYFLGDLTELCSQYLFMQLCPSNCLDTWLTACLYRLESLEFVCRHLFVEILPLIEIKSSTVADLPTWFIMNVLLKSNLPDVFPVLLPALIVVWLLKNFKQRQTVATKIFVLLGVSEQTILMVFDDLDLNQTERACVKSVFARAFVFTAYKRDKPWEHDLQLQKPFSPDYSPANTQHLSVMLLNETKNTAILYCLENKEWRTLHLPFYRGTPLGIVAGNLLVRVVAKGSSVNLYNLRTRESQNTPCVLNTLRKCGMNVAFLPTQSNFFLSSGHLHVALVVQQFRNYQVVVFRFEPLLNCWSFLVGFPLIKNRNHTVLRTYSTSHNLVYLIVTVRPFRSAAHLGNTLTEFSHVFVLDLRLLEVVGSSCGYFGNSILNNDSFILMNKLHFVTNRRTLLVHSNKSTPAARVLVINPYDQKCLHILYPLRAPKLERLPIISLARKDRVSSESLSAVKEATLCLLHHMGPYISNMFIFDIERHTWFQTPSPPPIFKKIPSNPILIHTYAPVGTLLTETGPDLIPSDENFFKQCRLHTLKC